MTGPRREKAESPVTVPARPGTTGSGAVEYDALHPIGEQGTSLCSVHPGSADDHHSLVDHGICRPATLIALFERHCGHGGTCHFSIGSIGSKTFLVAANRIPQCQSVVTLSNCLP